MLRQDHEIFPANNCSIRFIAYAPLEITLALTNVFFDRVAAKIALFQQVNRSSFGSVLNLFETTATIICSTPPPPSVHCPPSIARRHARLIRATLAFEAPDRPYEGSAPGTRKRAASGRIHL